MDGGYLLTCKSFDPNRIIPFGTRFISVKVLPIPPYGNVLQVWVSEPILKILRRHNSISPGSIDKVIERNMTLLALRVHICRGNGPTLWFTLFLELDRRNFSFLENSDTAGSCMLEEDMIKF